MNLATPSQASWIANYIGRTAWGEGLLKERKEVIKGQVVNRTLEDFGNWAKTLERGTASDIISTWNESDEVKKNAVYSQCRHLDAPIV